MQSMMLLKADFSSPMCVIVFFLAVTGVGYYTLGSRTQTIHLAGCSIKDDSFSVLVSFL